MNVVRQHPQSRWMNMPPLPHPNRNTGRALVVRWVLGVVMAVLFCPGVAQALPTSKLVGEVIEALTKKTGRKAARELAEFGGEKGVAAVLEKAAREGGEELAERTARLAEKHGVDALRAVERAPARCVTAIEKLPDDLAGKGIRALAREPDRAAKLIAANGDEALEVLARHGGSGPILLEKLGKEAIPVARRLSEEHGIRLARMADDLAKAPVTPSDRATILQAIGKAPGAMLDWIERHPRLLLTGAGAGAGTAVLVDASKRILGSDGSPGTVERILKEAESAIVGDADHPGFVERALTRPTVLLGLGGVAAVLFGLSRLVKLLRRENPRGVPT